MKLGSPATDSDFYGRAQELKEIWRYIESDHVCLPGVRRLGKSSILLKLVEQGSEHGVLACWVDVSTVSEANQFLNVLEQSYPEGQIKSFLKQSGAVATAWLKRVKKVDIQNPEVLGGGGLGIELNTTSQAPWLDKAVKLEERLRQQPCLLLLDEFPVMLQKIIARDLNEAVLLLSWLRKWRQHTQNTCRFVFTGSIGLQSLLEKHGLATLMNDCYDFPLGPFSKASARGLWKDFAAADNFKLSSATIDHALEKIGWLSPFFLCLLLDESMRAARERVQESTSTTPPGNEESITTLEVEDVNSAYETLLASRSRFQHWEKRLKDSLSPQELPVCMLMLRYLAKQAEGLTLRQLNTRLSKLVPDSDIRSDLIQSLQARLCDEGYTSSPDSKGRIAFRSFILRDWWRRNHV